jgi:mannitol/fructose-specific phosphotransferase system IIA component (Ntr-type)
MNLTDILSLDQFLPKVAAGDRWAVIDALVEALVRTGKIRAEDRDIVRKAVREREASKSTGIGYGLAMPHASVPCVQDVVAVVARLNPPVDFQALDDQPVKLCILLLTPQGQFQRHLQTLSAFARFLSDKDRRAKLESAQTAEEMLAVFRA